MFSRVAGANRPRGAILALALVALAARVSLANAESSANASCRTGDECDADDAFPDGSSERAAHPPSPPPIRSPRRPSAILAAPFEDDRSAPSTPADSNANRNLPRHLFRPLPFLPDPDASSSAPPLAVGAHVTSGSPCPPPPSGICLSLPYRADVVAPAPDASRRDCRGSFVYRAACGALRAGDAAKSVLAFFGGSTRREGRVIGARPRDLTTASRLAADVPTHAPSADVELDHSLAMVCRVRDEKTCATVYDLQREYDDAHVEMTSASLAAEAAFDAYEAAKATCEDAARKVADVDAAARAGAEVCRERVVEVEATVLAATLRDARERLVDSRGEDGGKCDREDLFETAAALRGEDEDGSVSRARGKVVRVDRLLEDGTPVTVGDDANSSSIVLSTGYVMPEAYFEACGRVIEHLDAMIDLLGGAQRVRENVCSEYTPAEVNAMRAESRGACAGVPEKKHAYARALEKAQAARAREWSACTASSSAKKNARRALASLDEIIAETAAAGGNEKARAAVKSSSRSFAASCPATASTTTSSPFDAATVKSLDDGANAAATTMSSTSALVAALGAYASAGASPNADAVAAFSDAFARRVATTASTREVANALSAFARVGVVPSASAATAANRVVATRANDDAALADVVAALHAFADVPIRPSPAAFRALFTALERESSRADVADVADALRAFAAAASASDIAVAFPPATRDALAAAVARDAPRASPEEIALAIVAYGEMRAPAGRVVRTRAFVSRRGERRVGARGAARFQNRASPAPRATPSPTRSSRPRVRIVSETSPRCWTRTPTRGRRPRATRSSRSEVPSRASRRIRPRRRRDSSPPRFARTPTPTSNTPTRDARSSPPRRARRRRVRSSA